MDDGAFAGAVGPLLCYTAFPCSFRDTLLYLPEVMSLCCCSLVGTQCTKLPSIQKRGSRVNEKDLEFGSIRVLLASKSSCRPQTIEWGGLY